MSRTLLLKVLYVLAAATLCGLGFVLSWTVFKEQPSASLWLVALLFFIPGRVQGFYYRRFFRGRRLLDSGRPDEALEQFRAFLGELQDHPGRKRLVWLAWAVYTTDIEAMTWNNIGAAHTARMRWTEAKEAFETALKIDPRYGLPHVNLARVAVVEGERLEGERLEGERQLAAASQLGYRATSIDALVHEMQAVLARIEGR